MNNAPSNVHTKAIQLKTTAVCFILFTSLLNDDGVLYSLYVKLLEEVVLLKVIRPHLCPVLVGEGQLNGVYDPMKGDLS